LSCDVPTPDCCADGGALPYESALQLVLSRTRPLPAVKVALAEALGGYLAAPAKARWEAPRFEQSAMDGYAVQVADLAAASPAQPVALRVAGEMAAGATRRVGLKPGTAVRVFTGSPLPGGTGAIVVQEVVMREGDVAVFRAPAREGTHIRRVGEEYRKGDELLPAGVAVTPPVIGLLAQLGQGTVKVGGRPRVLVVTMGDELVPAGTAPGRAQVVDANGPALCAALRAAGALSVKHVCVRDDAAALRRALAAGLRTADLVVTVGGASVGDHDHVPAVRAELGITALFGRVAIRPGLPNWFGLSPQGVPVFGLPGNPVSALVSFELLVRPALRRLMGASCALAADGIANAGADLPALSALLECEVSPAADRLTWLRARLAVGNDGQLRALPERGQGSHMLSNLARAQALAVIAAGGEKLPAGTSIPVRRLEWFER
jgi:molybdopterin molybdotransferase